MDILARVISAHEHSASSTRVIKPIRHPQGRPRVLHASLRRRRAKRWRQLPELRPMAGRVQVGRIRPAFRFLLLVSFRIQRLAAVSVGTSRYIVIRKWTFAIRVVFFRWSGTRVCWQEDWNVVVISLLHEMRRGRRGHAFAARLVVGRIGVAMAMR